MKNHLSLFTLPFAAVLAAASLSCSHPSDDPSGGGNDEPSQETAKTTLSLTAKAGWDIYVAGNDRDGGNYRYGPSIIVNDDGSIDAWFSANGDFYEGVYPLYDDFTSRDAVRVSGGDIAQAFTASEPFWCVKVCCPTWAKQGSESVTISIYRWDTDYGTSVAAEPVRSKRFEKFNDNANLCLFLDDRAQDDPAVLFEAGRYLLVLSDGTPDAGVWRYKEPSRDAAVDSKMFIGGKEVSGGIFANVFTHAVETEGGLFWDCVSHRRSTDGGRNWTPEVKTLLPTTGSLDGMACCDPGVACWGGWYYIGYTSTLDPRGTDNDVYVARGRTPEGPWEKWNGSGWGGDKVAPVIDYDASPDHYGAGEPCFVVKDDVVYFYYSWNESAMTTRVATASASDPDWPASLKIRGKAIDKAGIAGCDHSDVKYCPDIKKFVAVNCAQRWTDASYMEVWLSSDGISFKRSGRIQGKCTIMPKLHNLGISGDALGHFDPSKPQYVSYAYGDVLCFWNTYFNPLQVELK
ncbi:MAG: hypothetical protein II029_06795 [Bacteroidales bacterium]|nr:hypothetical protein [Bacteroidales bacterium]